MKTSRSLHSLASLLLGSSAAVMAFATTGAAGGASAQTALQTTIGDCRPISPDFTGINAKMLISDPWNTDWLDALVLTGVGNIRYPGGTAGNDWDWKIGRSERHKDYSYLPTQIGPAVAKAGVMPMWVVNFMTRDLQHCLDGLAEAASSGSPIRYVEIGNEFYLGRNAELFPTGKEYGLKAKEWIAAIKQAYPGVKCALSATMKYNGERTKNWTRDAISACDNYDALVAHMYVFIGLEPQTAKGKKPSKEERSQQQAAFDAPDGPMRVIGQPLLMWRDLRRNNDLPADAEIWATEFAQRDYIGSTNETWAMTLFAVNQIHAFLDDGRVTRFCCQLLQRLARPDREEGEDAQEERTGPDSPGGEGRSFHLTAEGLASICSRVTHDRPTASRPLSSPTRRRSGSKGWNPIRPSSAGSSAPRKRLPPSSSTSPTRRTRSTPAPSPDPRLPSAGWRATRANLPAACRSPQRTSAPCRRPWPCRHTLSRKS